MLKKISKIPFSGTPEQEEKLHAVIAECNGDKSLLMHVMQEAQLIYGYLPFEVQAMIAEGMDVPLEKVYGVSTFYAQFASAVTTRASPSKPAAASARADSPPS